MCSDVRVSARVLLSEATNICIVRLSCAAIPPMRRDPPPPPLPPAPCARLQLLCSNEPVSSCVDSHALARRLLHALGRFGSALEREDAGRHIRERTREAMQEAVADSMTEVLQRTLAGERIRRLGGHAQPLCALLERWLSESVHHLCLLRCRFAGGTLPPEVWRIVVFSVLQPCLIDFGYLLEQPGDLPLVRIAPLPILPSTQQRTLLLERGTTTDQDEMVLRALFRTWLRPDHSQAADLDSHAASALSVLEHSRPAPSGSGLDPAC